MPGEAHRAQGLGKLIARRKKRIKKSWGEAGERRLKEEKEEERKRKKNAFLTHSFLHQPTWPNSISSHWPLDRLGVCSLEVWVYMDRPSMFSRAEMKGKLAL